MSGSNDYTELGELIFICLSGEADRDQMERLEAELARDERARRYYSEFVVIYAGLRQSPASLLGLVASDIPIPSEDQSCLDVPDPLRGTIRSVGRARRQGESETAKGDLQRRPFSQKAMTHDIESYARRQLEAFLDQQRREEPLRRRDGVNWDFADALARAAQAMKRLMGTMARVAKVGAVMAAFALVGLIVGLHIHANQVVATVTDSTEAVWETPREDAQLRRGWMRLEQGFAQIAFKKGARVILQAPCEFELCSSNSMFLEDGRVTAYVPERAAGFTVRTPKSSVIDFGTEFGLLTGGGRGDEVHVFDGRVRFRSARRRRSTRWDQPLKRGQAATIDAAGQVHVQALKDRPRQFVRELPNRDLPAPLTAALPDANELSRPEPQWDPATQRLVGWWKFDEGSGSVVGDSSGNGHTGRLVGAEWVAPGWNQEGYCLEFRYRDGNDHVDLGRMDVVGQGLTITAWVNPYTFSEQDARVISKARTGATADGHWWMLSATSGRRMRFRVKTDEGKDTLTLIGNGGTLRAGEWQFVAGRWDGTMACTFVGTAETGRAAKAGSLVATDAYVPVAIGNQPLGAWDGRRAWDGLIDDVRIYNYGLTEEELETVMTGAGQPASDSVPGGERTDASAETVGRAPAVTGKPDSNSVGSGRPLTGPPTGGALAADGHVDRRREVVEN